MKKKCLNPNCESKSGSRGLCIPCYNTALEAVRNGVTTWEELEKNKKVKAATRGKKHIREWLLDFKKK